MPQEFDNLGFLNNYQCHLWVFCDTKMSLLSRGIFHYIHSLLRQGLYGRVLQTDRGLTVVQKYMWISQKAVVVPCSLTPIEGDFLEGNPFFIPWIWECVSQYIIPSAKKSTESIWYCGWREITESHTSKANKFFSQWTTENNKLKSWAFG